MTSTSFTPFPLSFYIGATTLSSSAQASFLTSYDAFVSDMGAAPGFEDVYLNQTLPTSQWLSQGLAAEAIYAGTPELTGTIPIIGLPMASSATGSETADQMFKDFAAGDYTTLIDTLVQQYAADGFTTQYWRPGWEMNLKAQPWYVGSDPQTQADYIAAFQAIYTELHAAGAEYGVNIQVVWNPAANASYTGLNINSIYPGNNYVDVIAADDYSGEFPITLYDWTTHTYDTSYAQWAANPANLIHYWNYPAANAYTLDASNGTTLSLPQLLAMAVADNKPVAIAEAGAGSGNTSDDLPADDPTFPQWLAQTLQASGATVDFVTVWDTGADAFTGAGTNKPLEAAAWAQYFGAGTASVSGSVTVQNLDGSSSAETGVTVSLINASGTTLLTQTTDSNGDFTFSGLVAGTYQVLYTAPSGTFLEPGSEATATTGLSPQVTLVYGQSYSLTNEVLLPSQAELSGQVQLGGAGQSGVTVTLLFGGASVASTTTDSTGSFSFIVTQAGAYQVKYTAPTGELLQTIPSGTVSTGLSETVTLALGAATTLPVAVLAVAPATISGSVTYGSVGQSGVPVSLYNLQGNKVASTSTGSGGAFSFTGLAANTYEIVVTPPSGEQLAASNPVDGQGSTVTVVAGQTAVVAPLSLVPANTSITGSVTVAGAGQAGLTVSLLNASGQLLATSHTNSAGVFIFTGLTAGTYLLKYAAPTGAVLQTGSAANISTGLTSSIKLVTGQALVVPTEAMLTSPSSITAKTLHFGGPTDPSYGSGDQSVVVALLNASGTVIATTVSSSTGWFIFTNIAAGTYQLQYTAPSGQGFSAKAGVAGSNGLTASFTVPAGTAYTAPSADLVTLGDLTGQVLLSGSGQAQVAVALVSASSGQVVASTATNSSGVFNFIGVASGVYEVDYTAPSGFVLQAGGAANTATGLTAPITYTAGQTVALANETLAAGTATITSKALHFGGVSDPSYGGGDPGVTVYLVNASGVSIASVVSSATGWFAFTNVAAGTYQLRYATPAGQVIEPGTTALTTAFTVTPGEVFSAPVGSLMSALTLTGTGVTATESAGSYVVTGTASHSTLTLGAGNQIVTLTGSGNSVVTGNGNQTITLSGTGNTISIGTGSSTINAGTGSEVVHAAGGNVTISATGGGNLFDSGAGMSFLNADGSAGNTFMLNAAASGTLTTITGFSTADILDIKRTLAGTGILANLSNVGKYITAAVSGSNTDLYVDPTGGSGTPKEFAVLIGVQTTVAQLYAAHVFSLS
jgi:hypothetical protein